MITCLDDFRNHSSFGWIFVVQLISLVLSTVRNDLSRAVGFNIILDFLQPFVLFVDEIISTQVHQIHYLLCSYESMAVKNHNFIILPFSMTDPSIFHQQIMSLDQNISLFSCIFRIISLYQLLKILQTIGDILQILENELTVDDIHIPDWIN